MNCCALVFVSMLLLPFSRQFNYDAVARQGYMTGFIINGIEVPISMYPHVVGIVYSNNLYCGGSIISKRIVLTAAHCIVSPLPQIAFTPTMITISAGSTLPNLGIKYNVCNIMPHPKYDAANFTYDIGLISITKPFKFGPLIQPASIAPNQKWKNKKYKFIIAGYGVVTTKGSVFASHLQATRLSYVDTQTCNRSQTNFKGFLNVPKHVFCLIGHGWSGDCYGDSGSGILWKRYLVGLVSHGRDTYCGSDMTPSMYTDVVYFKKWIEQASRNITSKTCYKDVKKMSHVGIDYYFSSEEMFSKIK